MQKTSLPVVRASVLVLVLFALVAASGCGGAPAKSPGTDAKAVFDMVAPSIVAILNDDQLDREEERKELETQFGDDHHAPKRVIDVSSKRSTPPHGTGFMIEGGQIVTAAHVILRPDRLKITTRGGDTVDAELVRLDEVRDVAILKPKTPLKIPALKMETVDIKVGQRVWALGHTGSGAWALSWGMSAGIASGIVDMFGAKLVLFDAAVYPGFSGGPVVDIDTTGTPRVIGVNHAILFTGPAGVASISSAVYAPEVREVIAGNPPAVQAALSAYAKKQRERVYADLFITDRLVLGRDVGGEQVASIFGHSQSIQARTDGVRIPAVAMLFGLPKGSHDLEFVALDPQQTVMASWPTTVRVEEHQRVAFASASLRFNPKAHGRYHVAVMKDGKEVGRSLVNLELDDDDDDLAEEHDGDVSDDGDPDVDIVVAEAGNDDPLIMRGIRATWVARSYPRRVGYTWMARGTRGWSGRNVSITAFVLDKDGAIVGRSEGCFKPELRPAYTWACFGSGSTPLAAKEGAYDIVFAINDQPVAWWPMEATIRKDHSPGSDMERWLKELRRASQKSPKKQGSLKPGDKMPGAKSGTATPEAPKPEPQKPEEKPAAPSKPGEKKPGAKPGEKKPGAPGKPAEKK